MSAQPVEWVLVIYYGSSAHRATYGRLDGKVTSYTKDYIQLSRKKDFLDTVKKLFPELKSSGSERIIYRWVTGKAPGNLVLRSADRPHLKWETRLGAPDVWKMSLTPQDSGAATIPGDPSHREFEAAENELALLSSRGAGQPYLLAIKLRNESQTLHLRCYLGDPAQHYAWADLKLIPQLIQTLAKTTSRNSALAWSVFHSGGIAPNAVIEDTLYRLLASKTPVSFIDALDDDTGRELAYYLRRPGYGLFFDPAKNHDAWSVPPSLGDKSAKSFTFLDSLLRARYPVTNSSDAAAETYDVSPSEVAEFRGQIEQKNYEVPDSKTTIKTRGSAQRAFAEAVKKNYAFRCAITGIETEVFLVASHIVPWSKDQTIRLDPSNGICLSVLVDRAFENGYLLIEDDLTIRIDWSKIEDDLVLQQQLKLYDGCKITAPTREIPKAEYLYRRREFVRSEK
ncbi:HNH endonuclease [Salinisphaera aquimarina]|uniref:HNH endonuclease n=1 Tax=Salinisphaera aquimarina TaxID=2094031 RepID=A0ABV7EKG2_9GAMM